MENSWRFSVFVYSFVKDATGSPVSLHAALPIDDSFNLNIGMSKRATQLLFWS